ncbi:GNAT family N-acetyltransferase [Chloroflexi bacterium TSY]|nr:GNAT family N-acetyltransferase [Chloroflexi bacterium TSY]
MTFVVDSRLAPHNTILHGKEIVLRPMTEDDWEILLKWNSDPEILYFAEGADAESYSLDEIQQIYRGVPQHAYCFIIEREGIAVGDCWLQEMNLERILRKYPEKNSYRIDLIIGEKTLWGCGIGSEVIQLLTNFAFTMQNADFVFGCDIADHNQASQRIFEKNGYHVDTKLSPPPDRKAAYRYDVVQSRECWADNKSTIS